MMQGLITEKNWRDIDKIFAGVHRFYRRLPRKPRTFLELLELYWKRKSPKHFSALLIFFALWGFVGGLSMSQAMAQAQEEPEPSRATLKLGSVGCPINTVESAVLHLKGIVQVDIESKKDHLIVDYMAGTVTPQQMADAIGRKGCMAHVLGAGGTGGATVK